MTGARFVAVDAGSVAITSNHLEPVTGPLGKRVPRFEGG